MRVKLLKNGGFSLAEVMVSAAILVLITAGFATVGIMMRSLSNVKTRNVAYSIANDRMNELHKNPSGLPDFVVNETILPNAVTADGTYVVDNTINNRQVGEKSGIPIYKTFTRRQIFYPVARQQGVDSAGSPVTNMVNLVNADKKITAQSRLVRVIIRVTWQDNLHKRTYRIEEEDYIRKAQ